MVRVRGNDFQFSFSHHTSFKCTFKGEVIMMMKTIIAATDIYW